ncbi:MAG TPA: hypothetical protein VEL47_03975 [Myxococcota bacterium]|nr:hypothetical protein [Myxococcota bacterium]
MRYPSIFLVSLLCATLAFAMDSGQDATRYATRSETKKLKDLTRVNSSKSRHLLTRVKKRDSEDSVEEITTYEDLLAIATNGDTNKFKSVLVKFPKAILLIDANGDNIIHRFTAQNNAKLLQTTIANLPPDIACQAINTRNLANSAPLHIAASNGAHAIAIYLLASGAWVDLPGPSTVTAYIIAIHKQDAYMAYILSAFGAQVHSAPLSDKQQIIAKIKAFSSSCRDFFTDVFISKNTMSFDKSYVDLLLDFLDDQISELNENCKITKNLKNLAPAQDDHADDDN